MTTTLLAVDDSKTMRKVMEITFAGESFKTVVVADAAGALAKAQAERPNVALIDATLEGTNGYDLCRQIKGASPATMVLLLSNKAQPYDKGRGAAAGADDFMDKPFDTQQMIDKVTALAKRAAQAAAAPPAPAPVPMTQPQPFAAKPPEGPRQRIQTLAYGANPIPAPATASAVAPAKTPGGSSPFGSRAPAVPAAPAFLQSAPPVAAIASAPPAPAVAPPAPATVAPIAAPVAPVASAATPSAVITGNGAQAEFANKLGGLGLTPAQVEGVLALSRDVVERVVWEVVPTLAEAMIKEEIARLTRA